MTRSIWKGPVRVNTTSYMRNETILPSDLDEIVEIHNGLKLFPVLVTNARIGHKFGEFVPTKQSAVYKRSKLKKLKKKK